MLRNRVGIAEQGERALLITDEDMKQLNALLEKARYTELRGSDYLESLENELAAARVVTPEAIPPDVVTMHSTVRLFDLDTAEPIAFTLVFPDEADIDRARVSVLAPLGTAVLGYRAGDTLCWHVPDGVRRLKVVEVLYQPEAAGGSDRRIGGQ